MKVVIVATSLDSDRLLSCMPIKWRTKYIYLLDFVRASKRGTSRGGVNFEIAHVSTREGFIRCSRLLTWGREGSKIAENMLT